MCRVCRSENIPTSSLRHLAQFAAFSVMFVEMLHCADGGSTQPAAFSTVPGDGFYPGGRVYVGSSGSGHRLCVRRPPSNRGPAPFEGLRMQLYKSDYLSDGEANPDRSQGGWPGTGNVGPHDVDVPPLPVMTGSMFVGGKPLFPGAVQEISGAVLSPGQIHAVKCALAFAAVDKSLNGRPLVAYFGSVVQDGKVTGNIATLAEVEEVMSDEDGKITSVSLAGVSRAIIPRVRQVRDKPLLVANKWKVYLDDIPPASYMHTLERMRSLANQVMAEHDQRRQLSAKIFGSMATLQICDELDGSCDTEALLELGPAVYAKAMEIVAARNSGTQSQSAQDRRRAKGDSDALVPMETLAQRYAARVQRWSDLWPEWGDEKDGELRHLRCMSFAAWHSLAASASTSEMNAAFNGCCTIERIESALDKIKEDRRSLQHTLRVLEKLESNLGTVTKRRPPKPNGP